MKLLPAVTTHNDNKTICHLLAHLMTIESALCKICEVQIFVKFALEHVFNVNFH